MSETQQVHNSTGSIQSPEKIEDTFRMMKLYESNTEQSRPYPDRPGERDCQFFLRTGLCGYGNSCRFNHPPAHLPQGVIYHKEQLPERIGQPDCEYFLKTGACKYGSTCKYHHPKDRNGAGPVLFNVLGYPMRQGEKSCPYYMQNGMCRFGVACKFHHPHPQHQPQHHNGHTTYGMSGFPSVGFPYAGGLTMMSLSPATYGVMPPPATYGAMPPPATYGSIPPPATYGAMPRPPVPPPQAYMPFMVAPSQCHLPPQSWATYMTASNSHNNIGMTRPSLPAAYGSRVSSRPKISSPPSRSDSTTISNVSKSPAEKQNAAQRDKPGVEDSSLASRSDSTSLSNGKTGVETKKEDDNPA